jgi:hypothetical protein
MSSLVLLSAADLDEIKLISGPPGFLTTFGSTLYFLQNYTFKTCPFTN